MSRSYFEDIRLGSKIASKGRTITKEEIIDFATKYDPQPFHIDEEAAKSSLYGGLIASGWHTASLMMRLMVDTMDNQSVGLGSPGFDDLRWLLPVRPGDTLRMESIVSETRRSKSRPDMGIVRSQVKVYNQRDEVVLSFHSIGMYRTRPA